MISICSLIYKSPRYADSVWNSIHEFTPEIGHNARFFFVANDAKPGLLDHLRHKGYPFVRNENPEYGLDGYGPPLYMRGVYMGWNRAVMESDDIAVLVSSDFMFSPDWLGNLLKRLTKETIVTSKLVERRHPKYGVFPRAYEKEFGDHPDRFKKHDFLDFAQGMKKDEDETGGSYGPWVFHKENAIKAGLYPEGNPPGTYGDQEFVERLKKIGVRHITSLDSIVYHFKEGEMEE